MNLGPGSLKVVAGVSTLAVCGVSGVLVVSDPKPASAPLRPPVSASGSNTASLVIPPSCAAPAAKGGSVTLTAAEMAVVRKLQAATTPAQRRAILAGLPAAQRQQITAWIAAHGGTKAAGCSSAASGAGSGAAPVAPSVVDAAPGAQTASTSYVS